MGMSKMASNNRGVCYLTITGESRRVQTFRTTNPSDKVLDNLRSLEAAGRSVLKQQAPLAPTPNAPRAMNQVKKLADLHAAGILTDEEYAAKKADLLDRM